MNELAAPQRYSFVGGPFGSNLTARDYVQHGVPVIRGTNLDGKNSRFIDDGFVYVTEAKADSLEQNLAFPGDLVFTQRGTLGQVAEIPEQARYSRYLVSQSQMKLTVDRSKAHRRFLYHYFRSPFAVGQLMARVQATGVPHINLGILKSFPVLLPPLAEQKRIAAILDKADEIRRKRQEALALTDQLLRSAFLEMFGDPVTNPKRWPVRKLDQVAEVRSGVAKGRKLSGTTVSLPYMRVANVQDGRLDLLDVKKITVLASEVEKYALQPGDLLLTEGGDPDKLGRGAVWYGEVQPCIHQNHVFAVRLREGADLAPEFLSAQIGSPRGKRYFLQAAKQTTGIATINKGQLKEFPTLVPPLALQLQYVRLVSDIRAHAHRQEEASLRQRDLLSSLTARAFRGEL